MVNIYLISDTHFGHENIIRYCGRPFRDAAEMDAVLIERWNATIRPQDHVYHLGDVTMSSSALHRVMPCLQGHKRLVLGNHDNMAPIKQYAQYFQKILAWRRFDSLLLTHVPIHHESFGKARVNVHGHTHQHAAYPGGYINVSVEQTGYAPLHLDEVMAMARKVV